MHQKDSNNLITCCIFALTFYNHFVQLHLRYPNISKKTLFDCILDVLDQNTIRKRCVVGRFNSLLYSNSKHLYLNDKRQASLDAIHRATCAIFSAIHFK